MLKIIVKAKEHYEEDRNVFFMFPTKDTQLTLEHSLLSISKWEEKWHKPFLNDEQLTKEQTIDYLKGDTKKLLRNFTNDSDWRWESIANQVYVVTPEEVKEAAISAITTLLNDHLKDLIDSENISAPTF